MILNRLIGVLPPVLLLGAAVYLAGPPADDDWRRYVAAAVVAAPPALDLMRRIGNKIGLSKKDQQSLEKALRAAVVEIHRQNLNSKKDDSPPPYPGDVSTIGFHVWLISPRRRLIPHAIRRLAAFIFNPKLLDRRPFRPRLLRAAHFSMEPRESTDVPIRYGRGIVGRCLQKNQQGKILAVDWQRADRVGLLGANNEEDWNDAGTEVNLGLPYATAKRLAATYGQAAAHVVQRKGRAVGCVTLDLPPGPATFSLEDESNPVSAILLGYLTTASATIEKIPGL